jgi:hypothetical protein
MALLLVCITSCSSDDMQDSNNSSILGVWQLTAWNVEEGFDFNEDGTENTNLLNEIDCSRNETLIFDNNGVVSLNTTFNPDIDIALKDGSSNTYIFNVTCDTEGVISLATSYQLKDSSVFIGEFKASFMDNQITLVFKERIKIYNENFTEVIDRRDLTLVYTKL